MSTKIADVFVALGVQDNLDRGFSQAQKKTNIFSKGLGEIVTGGLRQLGAGIVNGVAGLAQAAIGQIGDSISKASDLNETTSKIEQIFGASNKEVLKFADNADVAFGQTKQQALDAAATFATFGKAAGLSGEGLTKFSTNFVGLASDLASFNNTSPEEAINAIGAALRGESEPLRKYGVLLDDATLRQKALELGLIKTTKEALTPQQKVLAAQKAIYEQTTAAQGDFARTSGGLANQQRILEAQMDNLKTTVGTALLPVMLTLTKALTGLATQYLPIVATFIQEKLVPASQRFADVMGELITTYLPPLQAFIVGQLIPTLASVAGVIENVVTTVRGLFTGSGGLNETVSGATVYLDLFKNWFDENLPRVQQIVETVLGAISQFWQENGETIMRIVNETFSVVLKVADVALRDLLDLVTLVLQLLTGDWEGAAETFEAITTRTWDAVKAIVQLALDGVKATLEVFINVALSAWDTLWANLQSTVESGAAAVVNAWSELFRLIGQKITNFGTEIYKSGGALVNSFLEGLQASWGTVETWFTDSLQGLRDKLPFSEPRDPASPLRGLAKSGKALIEQVQLGIDSASLNINSALPDAGLLAPALASATTTTNNNGHVINLGGISISVSGSASKDDVKQGVNDGLLSALRSAGLV